MTTWLRNEPDATRRYCVLDVASMVDGSWAPHTFDLTGKIQIRLGGVVWTAAGGTFVNTGFDGHWVYQGLQSESNVDGNEVELRVVDATYFAQTLVTIQQLVPNVNVSTWLGSAPAPLSVSGFVQVLLRCWLTDNAGGTPNALISGRVDAAASVAAVLDALLVDHSIVGSVADGIAIAAGLLQGNFFMDQTAFTPDGDQSGARLRLFRDGTATQGATPGGSGEGEFATFVVTTEYVGPNKIKDHRVSRQ